MNRDRFSNIWYEKEKDRKKIDKTREKNYKSTLGSLVHKFRRWVIPDPTQTFMAQFRRNYAVENWGIWPHRSPRSCLWHSFTFVPARDVFYKLYVFQSFVSFYFICSLFSQFPTWLTKLKRYLGQPQLRVIRNNNLIDRHIRFQVTRINTSQRSRLYL